MMRSIGTSVEGIIIVLFWSILMFSTAADNINVNQTIRDGQTLVSAGESFEMGFFSPGSSKNRYLGIWYKKKATGIVVWVANRDLPLHDKSGVLKITDQGTLVLLNSTHAIIWSSNSSRVPQHPVAQLLETGNLVVKDANGDNPENFLWQSFDYPSDTLLPGMKFGINFVTRLNRHLTSWKSDDDPGRGVYTFQCDPRGYPQFFIRNGSVDKFRIGSWNGVGFSGLPTLKPSSILNVSFVFNQNEVYYSYDITDSSIVSRLVLSQDGVSNRWTWIDRTQNWVTYLSSPADNCDKYALCGAYGSCIIDNSPVCGCVEKFVPKYPNDWNRADWSNGCVRRTPLDCKKGDGFLKYPRAKLPDTRDSWYNKSMTLEECETVCLKNCSCMAYANIDITSGGSGCLLWFGDLIDIRVFSDSGQDIFIRVAFSELDSPGPRVGSSRKKRETILVSLALSTGFLLLAFCLFVYLRKRKCRWQLKGKGKMGHNSEEGCTKKSEEDLELPLFDLQAIVSATNNFAMSNKLGEGGFGPVYKGLLEEGQEIAVKRLSKSSRQGLDEFKNEVIFIARLQHRNLVKVLGCCIQGGEMMLIYEYMPNRSLDSFIFDETKRTLLDWPRRFHIINGIARGLLYLHEDSRLRIIHRDLKASNILLDNDLNAKISDFGMARSFGGDETEGNTKRVVGTYGYMSPEYAVDGLFSVKSDVFSFGVLVLEILSGRRNRGFYHPGHHLNLLGHAWKLYKEGSSLELIDAAVGNSWYLSEVLRAIHVGLLCVQQFPEDRPTMSSVVLMLGSEDALPHPKEPGFFTERKLVEADGSSSTQAPISINEITMTLLEAR